MKHVISTSKVGISHYWTGTEWSTTPDEASIFDSTDDAVSAIECNYELHDHSPLYILEVGLKVTIRTGITYQ